MCADCKTPIMCIDGKAHPDECGTDFFCNEAIMDGFAVCHQEEVEDCVCPEEGQVTAKDHYSESAFITCTEEDGFQVQNCDGSANFNEETGYCESKRIDCKENGQFANKENCAEYYRCMKIAGGWITFEFSCTEDKTHFDEVLQKCVDPCSIVPGDFDCEAAGRFPNPTNCREFYECTTKRNGEPGYNVHLRSCPTDYHWVSFDMEERDDGGYIATYDGICLPEDQSACTVRSYSSTCSIPEDWCPDNGNTINGNSGSNGNENNGNGNSDVDNTDNII